MNSCGYRLYLLSFMLACCACTQPRMDAFGLIVSYEGPSDKYVPCLVLSGRQHEREAMRQAEKIGCREFASLVGTTVDGDFFRRIETLRSSKLNELAAELAHIRFVVLGPAENGADINMSMAEGISTVQELSKYFPAISSRIDAEFVHRFAKATSKGLEQAQQATHGDGQQFLYNFGSRGRSLMQKRSAIQLLQKLRPGDSKVHPERPDRARGRHEGPVIGGAVACVLEGICDLSDHSNDEAIRQLIQDLENANEDAFCATDDRTQYLATKTINRCDIRSYKDARAKFCKQCPGMCSQAPRLPPALDL